MKLKFKQKLFLDPICGNGNIAQKYLLDIRFPEIRKYFNSDEDTIKYIWTNEIYLFNYIYKYDTEIAKEFNGIMNPHVYHINYNDIKKICSAKVEILDVNDYFNIIQNKLKQINFKNIEDNMVKFDYIIQNPPYKGDLHLSFLEEGLNMLSKTGKMIIIEPASWLIDLRPNSKNRKKYDNLKKLFYNNKNIKSIKLENLNREFNINLYCPLSIICIDNSKKYNTIEFNNCGKTSIKTSIYDCNLIENNKLFLSILNKINITMKTDIMSNHIYKIKNSKVDKNTYYTKYGQTGLIAGCCYSQSNGLSYYSDSMYIKNKYGEFSSGYFASNYRTKFNSIENHILYAVKRGSTIGTLSDKPADCLFGTKKELENFKYNTFNTLLMLYLNLSLTNDQNNCSKKYMPWLVDKQYTDEEINDKFNFTDEEIIYMKTIVEQFERHSEWFKRYSNGND